MISMCLTLPMTNSSGIGEFLLSHHSSISIVFFVVNCELIRISWYECRVVVQGQGPGPRYGHVMDLVAQRFLVSVSGNDGKNLYFPSFYLFMIYFKFTIMLYLLCSITVKRNLICLSTCTENRFTRKFTFNWTHCSMEVHLEQ